MKSKLKLLEDTSPERLELPTRLKQHKAHSLHVAIIDYRDTLPRRGPLQSLPSHTGFHSSDSPISDDFIPGNIRIDQSFLEQTRTHHHTHTP